MEIRTYAVIIRRYWWVVLLATLVAAATAFALDKIRKPSYSASARVVARPATVISDTRTIVDLLGQMGGRYITGTFAQSFSSTDVKAQARQSVGLSPVEAANYPLAANVLPDSSVLEISGSGPDPTILTDYLNTTVSLTISSTKELFRVVELQLLEPAVIPTLPSSPQPARDVPFGAGLGLGMGLLLAFTLDYLRAPRRGGAPAQASTLAAVTPLPLKAERD